MVEKEKWCLVIRSVPFQQMDKIIPALTREFPGHRLAVLTHPHGVQMASSYAEVDEVIPYSQPGSFDREYIPEAVKARVWDVVIVPVANVSGSGFYNVLRFGAAIAALSRFLINLPGELKPFTPGGLIWGGSVNGMRALLAAVGAAILWLPWWLVFSLASVLIPQKSGGCESSEGG
ncbi:hypothetical protein HM1_1242 [Heliomicrobium modesticaldum Ice1]|uniref:Uncharacterized protein n=1 Tax=Heliobacterium modesticaldum (strain ATCC 51547 / Ice1) TaxID=498761 RepID=B0TH09_HELMI|nr:hypothetical protein [Heliomicrobium modesticaldum]ABZ83334.1 hypothetical protein HM1_1242 [Heliomicrobium modesticaldum Ice1]